MNRLAPKWMFTLAGAQRSLEVTPVVVDGVMYVTAVNEAYALDARNGREIWHYSRPRSQGLAGDAASGINRGVAVLRRPRIHGDRQRAPARAASFHRPASLGRRDGGLASRTMARPARRWWSNDLVIAGVSGGDEGVRGFLERL